MCLVENTRSHLNPEVTQNWAWIVLVWETAWELQVLLAWVQVLMLLSGKWTMSIRAPIGGRKILGVLVSRRMLT